jgi:NIPSNAP
MSEAIGLFLLACFAPSSLGGTYCRSMPIDRRKMLAGLAASTISTMQAESSTHRNTYLEVKTWRLHNSAENQGARVADFLGNGLAPALERAGGKLAGAFGNVISSDGPFYVTLSQFASLASFGEALDALAADKSYQDAENKLSRGTGLPFVRLESSLLKSFDVFPEPAVEKAAQGPRVFELRTYESQSLSALHRKVGMFNDGEARIFMRLGFRPVFFGETLVGPRQPNLMYMLSYDSLAAHDKLWEAFGADPEWQKLRSEPGLGDAEIVANISNVILRPLPFSPIR